MYDAIAYAVRTDSIKKLIEEFGSRHLTREYITFAFNLCDKISITPGLDILRGQKTIWAASIVHVIARLNFLFESSSELVLTPALISAHFKTNKSTVGNRASQIQKICGLEPGTRGYCRQEIVDAVTFDETVDGIRTSPGKNQQISSTEEKDRKTRPCASSNTGAGRKKRAESCKPFWKDRGQKHPGQITAFRRDDKQLKLFD